MREGGCSSLQLVLLWPCPPCSLSHFLFLTWNLYLDPSLLSALHSWLNSDSREVKAELKSDLHSAPKLAQSRANPPACWMLVGFMWHRQKGRSRRLIYMILVAAILPLPHTSRRELEKKPHCYVPMLKLNIKTASRPWQILNADNNIRHVSH